MPEYETIPAEENALPKASIRRVIVCAAALIPTGVTQAGPFAGFVVHGPLDFAEVGILAALTRPLAEARISVFAISSYDTDTLLVPLERADAAWDVKLQRALAGHALAPEHTPTETMTATPTETMMATATDDNIINNNQKKHKDKDAGKKLECKISLLSSLAVNLTPYCIIRGDCENDKPM